VEYKITWLTLRVIPNTPVNREKFYRRIIKALGLGSLEDKFVNSGGNKHYFSTASYNGINIKLPFYETMDIEGFVIEIKEKGFQTVTDGSLLQIVLLIATLFDIFLPVSKMSCARIDVETDYIPPKVLETIPRNLKSNDTLIIGSAKSTVHGRYSENKITYVLRNKVSDTILCKMFDSTYDGFSYELKDFLENWKPHEMTTYCHVTAKEPRPSSATK